MSGRKKLLGIALMVVLAVVATVQAEVVFQEDFSGYDVSGGTTALLSTAQVGTWTNSSLGSPAINVRPDTLMDGSSGACLLILDGSTGSGRPSLYANFASYTASPLKISYDFKQRGAGGSTNTFAVFAKNSDGDSLTYFKTSKANTTKDVTSFYQTGASGDYMYTNRGSWYTTEIELPAMPASGQFTYKVSILDPAGTVVYTKDSLLSWSADAGPELMTSLLFTAPGVSDVTDLLVDDIVVETVPEPATMILTAIGGCIGLLRRRK